VSEPPSAPNIAPRSPYRKVPPKQRLRWDALKRPPKAPDRVYPLVKNQEYAYAYDWEHRPG